MVLGCDVGKIEHANGRAIEGASSKVHGELTRLHNCLVAASLSFQTTCRSPTETACDTHSKKFAQAPVGRSTPAILPTDKQNTRDAHQHVFQPNSGMSSTSLPRSEATPKTCCMSVCGRFPRTASQSQMSSPRRQVLSAPRTHRFPLKWEMCFARSISCTSPKAS